MSEDDENNPPEEDTPIEIFNDDDLKPKVTPKMFEAGGKIKKYEDEDKEREEFTMQMNKPIINVVPQINEITNVRAFVEEKNIDASSWPNFSKSCKAIGLARDDASALWAGLKIEKKAKEIGNKVGDEDGNINVDTMIKSPFGVSTQPTNRETAQKKISATDEAMALYNHDCDEGYKGTFEQWLNDSAVNYQRDRGVEVAIIKSKPSGEKRSVVTDNSSKTENKDEDVEKLIELLGGNMKSDVLKHKLKEANLDLKIKELEIEDKRYKIDKAKGITPDGEKPKDNTVKIPYDTGRINEEGEPVIISMTPEQIALYERYNPNNTQATSAVKELGDTVDVIEKIRGDTGGNKFSERLEKEFQDMKVKAEQTNEKFHELQLGYVNEKYTELNEYLKNQPTPWQKFKEAKSELEEMGVVTDSKKTQADMMAEQISGKIDLVAKEVKEVMKPVSDAFATIAKSRFMNENAYPPQGPPNPSYTQNPNNAHTAQGTPQQPYRPYTEEEKQAMWKQRHDTMAAQYYNQQEQITAQQASQQPQQPQQPTQSPEPAPAAEPAPPNKRTDDRPEIVEDDDEIGDFE